MNSLADIWVLLNAVQRRQFMLMLGLIFAMGCATLAGIFAVVPFFAVLGDTSLIERHAALSSLYRRLAFADRREFLTALGLAFLALMWLSNIINWYGSLALSRFAHRIGNHFCVALFQEYLRRDLAFHRQVNSATLLSNVEWEVQRGVSVVLQSWFGLLTQAVAAALILAGIVLLKPLLAAGVAVLLAGSYGTFYYATRSRLARNGLMESSNVEARARVAGQAFGGIKEVTVLRAQHLFLDLFADTTRAISRAATGTYGISLGPRHLLECALAAALVGSALYITRGGTDQGAWLAQLSFLGLSAYRLLPALQQMFHAAVKIRADHVAFSRIAADLRVAVPAAGGMPVLPVAPGAGARLACKHSIELRQVSFRHAEDRPWVIRGVNLSIPAGSMVGLTGASGSGKSTLVELILGLNTPSSGGIFIDGVPLGPENREAWFAQVGYVPQEIFLFDASLAQNVAVTAQDSDIDAARLTDAIHRAQLDLLVAELPHGVHQQVGERGARLSGGQRQRVGIARALYRRAPVLILDEATNALDAQTEQGIIDMLGALRAHHTVILIAHRTSALRRCDFIVESESLGRETRIARLAP